MNRRELLLLGAASACPTFAAHAFIAPPPSSPWYLLFISNGVYRVSGLYVIDLPASFGTATNYDKIDVSEAVRALFTFTGPHGVSPWNMLIGAPSSEYWQVYDRRNGRIVNLWLYDRFEVRFSDKSRVRVVFNGPNASARFWPLVGTERLPDGTRLYPGTRTGTGSGGQYKGREGHQGSITSVTPTVTTFSWSWSSQETPW